MVLQPDKLYDEALGPNKCWFCKRNLVSWASTCDNCGAATLPTRSLLSGDILKWNVISPLIELQCPILRLQMLVCFGRDNGGAIRLGEGEKKVLIVNDYAGVKRVSWSLEPKEGMQKVATKMWDKMGEDEWAEVHRVLDGVEG